LAFDRDDQVDLVEHHQAATHTAGVHLGMLLHRPGQRRHHERGQRRPILAAAVIRLTTCAGQAGHPTVGDRSNRHHDQDPTPWRPDGPRQDRAYAEVSHQDGSAAVLPVTDPLAR
jgi:hypothetical protein